MIISLDFDGVYSDAGKLKSEAAKRLYGKNIPPEKFKTEILVGEGILTLEQYRSLQKQIYGTRELGLLMEEVEGAFHYTNKLRKDGHNVKIITSRGGIEAEIAREWIRLKGETGLNLIGIGGGVSKAEATKGSDVYLDDDLEKLEPLVNIVPHRFLFSWRYNSHVNVNPSIAKRVNSWKQFYEEIKEIG